MHPTDLFTLTWLVLLAAEVLLVIDWGQTHTIATNPGRWREAGFARHFIGEHPTTAAVARYFAGWMVALVVLTMVAYGWRPAAAVILCALAVVIELVAVITNQQHDVSLFRSE